MNNKIHACSYDEVIEKNWPKGLKKTRQRVDIYKVLYSSDQPLSAAEIFTLLDGNESKEKYAFSTVYRNLLAFEKAGIITKNVLSREDNALYEIKNETHKHFAVCMNCHRKIPIRSCPIHEITHDLEKSLSGFKVTGHQLEIYGYCSDCQKKLDV